VREVLHRFAKSGISWPLPDGLDDSQLEERLYPKPTVSKRPQPNFTLIQEQLSRKGVTMMLLWQEYKAEQPDGYQYSQFCEIYRIWKGQHNISLHQVYKAGEKAFVDWAGPTIPVIDRETGEVQQAYIFVATLGASNYTFAAAFLRTDIRCWCLAHCLAFEFFGGIPEVIVPDNTKTAVIQSCRYEPILHPTYRELAVHYGTTIIPARVRKPQDKAKVECAVLVVERWILTALRNERFFSLDELNTKIQELLTVLNHKSFQKLDGSRHSCFVSLEQPALKPLPAERFQFVDWKKARVNVDCHVEFESNYYSVPYQWVKQEVELRVTVNLVEILHKGSRIASHPRCLKRGTYCTVSEHLLPKHREFLAWNPERLINWAKTIGPHTAELVHSILSSKKHPEQAYRACFGVMRLGKTYPTSRIEAASLRALACNAISYQSLKSILVNGLDQTQPDLPLEIPPVIHANIRGRQYFTSKGESH
jgi:transposase